MPIGPARQEIKVKRIVNVRAFELKRYPNSFQFDLIYYNEDYTGRDTLYYLRYFSHYLTADKVFESDIYPTFEAVRIIGNTHVFNMMFGKKEPKIPMLSTKTITLNKGLPQV